MSRCRTGLALPGTPGFPLLNILSGAHCRSGLDRRFALGRSAWRRAAILCGLAAGTACYAACVRFRLRRLRHAPWLVTPRWFPFGFGVNAELVIVFLHGADSARAWAPWPCTRWWPTGATKSFRRDACRRGFSAVALGSVLGAIVGGLSTIAYPDNMGMLRTTRVGSRYATLAAGILLIALGGFIKFDMLIVLVPQPVVSAAATLLFGIVFMHGVQMLAKWIGTSANLSWRGWRCWWAWAECLSRRRRSRPCRCWRGYLSSSR